MRTDQPASSADCQSLARHLAAIVRLLGIEAQVLAELAGAGDEAVGDLYNSNTWAVLSFKLEPGSRFRDEGWSLTPQGQMKRGIGYRNSVAEWRAGEGRILPAASGSGNWKKSTRAAWRAEVQQRLADRVGHWHDVR